jgi:hypothetical protein
VGSAFAATLANFAASLIRPERFGAPVAPPNAKKGIAFLCDTPYNCKGSQEAEVLTAFDRRNMKNEILARALRERALLSFQRSRAFLLGLFPCRKKNPRVSPEIQGQVFFSRLSEFGGLDKVP